MPKQNKPSKKLKSEIWVAIIAATATIITAVFASPVIVELIKKNSTNSGLIEVTTTATEVFTQQPFPESTLIPRIDKILEINFSSGDKTNCVTEDSNLGGYDRLQENYFVIGKRNGYITYCNIAGYVNQGSLEISADPIGVPDFFGYGVFLGFVGGSSRDQCSFEIRRDGTETLIAFGEYIEGKWSNPSTKLDYYNLDTNPHTLRLVLYPDYSAVGYIDDIKIAEHKFLGCAKGRIGFIAYGLGDTKISFDDLKLFALP